MVRVHMRHTRARRCACGIHLTAAFCLLVVLLLAGVLEQGADSKLAGREAEEPVQADH
jgi:hypothetical protein